MPEAPEFPLKVFYDGSCSVCSSAIEVYMRMEHGGRLIFFDISAPDFQPELYGIPLHRFMHEMHAIDRRNRVFRGVEAFEAIWQALPPGTFYRIIGTFLALPGIDLMARAGYWSFARIRRFLPKTKNSCPGGVCGLRRKGP
ncbi:DUF393 domain-containing protein [Geomonas sp. RF6]|uniref:thiol-disulfide oxidoreductase DCC family protein n=1 Tax=Geomonas sp. RF6 TaxID=2897342 RepID=UPI001E44DBE8|nr:DUF393 domain-containing protein [Geomonas sp. RF6]UFS69595.1 DUF393 domain-containing protein [Geomonas sp. RF6]